MIAICRRFWTLLFSSVIARGPQAAVAIHREYPGGAAPASTQRRCFPSSGLSAPAARRGTSPWIAALPSVARNDGGGGGALSPCVRAVARFFSSVIGDRWPPWQSIVSILGAPPLPPRADGVSRHRGFRPLQRGAAPLHGFRAPWVTRKDGGGGGAVPVPRKSFGHHSHSL